MKNLDEVCYTSAAPLCVHLAKQGEAGCAAGATQPYVSGGGGVAVVGLIEVPKYSKSVAQAHCGNPKDQWVVPWRQVQTKGYLFPNPSPGPTPRLDYHKVIK